MDSVKKALNKGFDKATNVNNERMSPLLFSPRFPSYPCPSSPRNLPHHRDASHHTRIIYISHPTLPSFTFPHFASHTNHHTSTQSPPLAQNQASTDHPHPSIQREPNETQATKTNTNGRNSPSPQQVLPRPQHNLHLRPPLLPDGWHRSPPGEAARSQPKRGCFGHDGDGCEHWYAS